MVSTKFVLTFLGTTCVQLAAANPFAARVTHRPTIQQLNKREPWPESVIAMVPKFVDKRFFSVDEAGNTKAIVDHFSTVTVTQSKRDEEATSKTTTARVGIHTAPLINGKLEYSFQVTPAVLEIIKNAAVPVVQRNAAAEQKVKSKRDVIRIGDPKLLASASNIANALNAEAGPSLISVDMGNVPLSVAAAEGALPEAASSVLLGSVAVSYIAIVSLVAWTWASVIHAMSSTPQLGLPHAVVIDMGKLGDKNKCSGSRPSCSAESCKGLVSVCTAGDKTGCACEDRPTTCNDEKDISDCATCGGVDGKCTTGDKQNCMCVLIVSQTIDEIPEYQEILRYQKDSWREWFQLVEQERKNISKNPPCGTVDMKGMEPPNNIRWDGQLKSPREVLYMIRETLCKNGCAAPANIPSKSVKGTKKNNKGCEMSILLSPDVEAYGVRDTAATDSHQTDCWDSFENIIEKCTKFNPTAAGWVNGPDDYEFYQMGYRLKNGPGKIHDDFKDGDEMPRWCPNTKPSCASCNGGSDSTTCMGGEYSGCDCDTVAVVQPPVPKATNCATAIAAAEIVCCGWSKDTQKTCANFMEGCGVLINLDAACQYAIPADGSSTYSTCGQFNKDDPIPWGTRAQDIAQCLVGKFNLDADLQFKF